MRIKKSKTSRGFAYISFEDCYKHKCSIQKSSLASEEAIWLGIDDANPLILHGDATRFGIKHNETCGWVEYPIPDEVSLTTRMHLTRKNVKKLIPILEVFVKTGDI